MVAALSLAACRQTVLIDLSGVDAGPTPDGAPAFCSGLPTEIIIDAPEVIVALDRSSTMNNRFGDSTVLGTARDALDVYAFRYQKVVDFGYVEFPGGSNFCSGTCCASMPSAPNPNYAKFDMALHLCDQNSFPSCATASYQRPTTPALGACEVVFGSPGGSSRYVLLITNGMPDCGGSNGGGPNSACSDAQATVTDMAQRFSITTVVVAPGQIDPMTSDCLGEVALNGGARNPPYYHPAQSQTDLANTIGDLIREFATDACRLTLTTTRIQDVDRVGVTWRDVQIPRDRNSGWELVNNYTIDLHGQWCDHLIEDGPADLAVFPDCNPIHH